MRVVRLRSSETTRADAWVRGGSNPLELIHYQLTLGPSLSAGASCLAAADQVSDKQTYGVCEHPVDWDNPPLIHFHSSPDQAFKISSGSSISSCTMY